MKICTKCSCLKENSEFQLLPSGNTRNECIICCNARAKKHYYANREAHMESVRQWRRENPDLVRRYEQKSGLAYRRSGNRNKTTQRYRANYQSAYREHIERSVLFEIWHGFCGICNEEVDPFDFEIDHIIPLSKGGEHSYGNTQPAHRFCNRSKGNRLP